MQAHRLRRWVGLFCALAVLGADLTPTARHALRLPERVEMAVGQAQDIVLDLPGRLAVSAAAGTSGLELDGAPATAGWRMLPGRSLRLVPSRPGLYTLRLRLFGFLPWRAVRVRAVPVPELVPGGQTVGIVLRAKGPLVVGLAALQTAAGLVPSPAGRAGVHVGDSLVSIDGHAVRSDADISAAVAAAGIAGTTIDLQVLRRGRAMTMVIRPLFDPSLGRYLLGARVRDGATGIGTLTFMEQGGGYGALGHAVVDPGLGTPVLLGEGQLLPSVISGMQPSRDGRPGEKVGLLVGGLPPLGVVTTNGALGVFGVLTRSVMPGPVPSAVPVALPDQIHPGRAELLTVVSGHEIGAFQMRITAVLPQRQPSSKGLVLRITDPRLLAATGGIVQGMSGSPILQDGRLVGAVTHVFIDDPSRGYGVLAQWMAEAAGFGEPRTPAI